MTIMNQPVIFKSRALLFVLLTLQISACTGQEKEKFIPDIIEHKAKSQAIHSKGNTTFPQIHSNLNGLVREFVRTMYQDSKGNYWFGTNGDGIIRSDGQILEKIKIDGVNPFFRVLEIVEDNAGNLWFGTSEGLIKYDGQEFTTFSIQEGLQKEEIWALTIDKKGLIWLGATGGVRHFDGKNFIPFPLPLLKVENAQPMLSDKLVFKIIEAADGTMWFATDGNGIFTYKDGAFSHLTAKEELTDNKVADLMEDSQGNIWIGTFNGGVSKFDGKSYTNYTEQGVISGEEAYNFYEDSRKNIWFTAEAYGVYCYDGKSFKQFTTEDGLTSNVTQSILEDNKGQIWFGSWQGLCIYDGKTIVDAKEKEPWTH